MNKMMKIFIAAIAAVGVVRFVLSVSGLPDKYGEIREHERGDHARDDLFCADTSHAQVSAQGRI
jgi:hypothetical protein